MERLNLMNVPRIIDIENYYKDEDGFLEKIDASSLEKLEKLEKEFNSFRSENSS